MSCTPTNLFVDRLVWFNDGLYASIMEGWKNYTPGEPYDCALKSVPCESKLMREVSFTEEHDSTVFWFDLLVSYVAMTIVTSLALFGNIFNIIIFSTNKIANDSTNLLLLAISVSDFLSCLVHSSLLVVCYLCFFDVSAAISGYNYIAPHSFHDNQLICLLSLDFIVVLAIQRAGAVFIPFRASIVFSYRNTKIAVFILVSLFIATLIPIYMSSPTWVFHPYFNKSISLHYEYHLGFTFTSIMAFQLNYSSNRYIVDLCLTIFFVSITVFKLKAQSRSRASLQAADNSKKKTKDSNEKPKATMSVREQKVMNMSLIICFVTFVIYMWHSIAMNLISKRVTSMFATPFAAHVFFGGKVFGVTSCAFNFFLYMKMSTPYREAFKKLFTRWWRRAG